MSVLDLYYRSAQRRLDLAREEVDEDWGAAFSEAERCRYCELAIGGILETLQYLRAIERQWRQAVYRGIEPLDSGKNQLMRRVIEGWLGLAPRMTKIVSAFERSGHHVDRADEYRQ